MQIYRFKCMVPGNCLIGCEEQRLSDSVDCPTRRSATLLSTLSPVLHVLLKAL